MQKAIIELIGRDFIVQDFAGDALKRDQFIFLYNIHSIIFDSALKDDYLKG